MLSYPQLATKFEEYLSLNPIEGQPAALYEPAEYIMTMGGKRFRPLLLLMVYQLFEDDIEFAFDAARSVEVFHNFTLVHDDIMDQAPLRRGKTTVHERFGINRAILSGDVMMILAFQFLQRYPDALSLMKMLNEAAVKVCEGQQWDVEFEDNQDTTIPDYLKMIEYKTAALLGAALSMGAITARAPDDVINRMYYLGINAGIAFQLQDDILDTYGQSGDTGKIVGGDIIRNKKTFLYIKTLEMSDESTRSYLRKIYGGGLVLDDETKIIEVKRCFNKVNVRKEAESLRDSYFNKAIALMGNMDVRNHEAKVLLESFIINLINRKS